MKLISYFHDIIGDKLLLNFGVRFQRLYKLQNSLYFCVFKYTLAVKQKVWNEAENSDRDWGEMLRCFSLSPYTPVGRVMLVRFARARLFTDFFTDFEKKPTVLQSMCT